METATLQKDDSSSQPRKRDFLEDILHDGSGAKYVAGALENGETISLFGSVLAIIFNLPEPYRTRWAHKVALVAAGQSAERMMYVAGGITALQNLILYERGEITAKEAMQKSAISAGEQGAVGFLTGYGASIFSGLLLNSENAVVRMFGKLPIPQLILIPAVKGPVEAISQYLQGHITGKECLYRMTKTSVRTLATATYATAGQMLIPVPALGALAGGAIGWIFSSTCYDPLKKALNDTHLAKERRIQIEHDCEATILSVRQNREAMRAVVQEYMQDHLSVFDDALDVMSQSFRDGHFDGVIAGANRISRKLGGEPEFNSTEEFEVRMKDEKPFQL